MTSQMVQRAHQPLSGHIWLSGVNQKSQYEQNLETEAPFILDALGRTPQALFLVTD